MPPSATPKDAYEIGGDTFRDGSQAIAKKVRDNPLGSMLIAFLPGVAVARRRTPKQRGQPERGEARAYDGDPSSPKSHPSALDDLIGSIGTRIFST
jgi:hypothetical protein